MSSSPQKKGDGNRNLSVQIKSKTNNNPWYDCQQQRRWQHPPLAWQLLDVSYVLPRGAKVALVGRNGTGKSTLLRILAENTCLDNTSVDTADQGMKYTGRVTAPRTVRVAYVEQEPYMPAHVSVADALLGVRGAGEDPIEQQTGTTSKNSVYAAVRRYRLAVANAEHDPDAFSAASAAMDELSGWNVLTKADEIATKLRIRHLQNQTLSQLSGGECKRVALATALVQEPDVLLLDEPTNFLSLAGVQWLSDVLINDKKLTILMVTHDRAFLDDVCDRILELDRGKLYEYSGTYADYVEGKQERLALEDAATNAAKAKHKIELEWMRRQPQARESKSKARIDAYYKLQKATKPRPQDPSLSIKTGEGQQRRIGGKILSMRHVNLRFGDRVMLNDFSYDFCKGDRVCLAGANGVGKTTFVRLLTGQQAPDSGVVEVGDTIVLGDYDQLGLQLDDPEQTVLAFVLERVQSREGGAMSEAPDETRRLLQRFEFPRPRWTERVSVLSGGEKVSRCPRFFRSLVFRSDFRHVGPLTNFAYPTKTTQKSGVCKCFPC
jgi:ABC transport system ATP-binding/permease protein